MAITALRNGSCSTRVVAEDLELEVEEGLEPLVADDLEELVLLEEFDDARKSSKRNKVVESVGGKIHTAAFLLLELKCSRLVRGGAICSEARSRRVLEA